MGLLQGQRELGGEQWSQENGSILMALVGQDDRTSAAGVIPE